ncbi:MAG: hypothetical protein R3E64_07435 [Halioglobus sp.]
MADFHFLHPVWLWLFLPTFAVLAYLRVRSYRQHNAAGQGVIAEHLAIHFRAQGNSNRNVLPIYSAALISTLMILVLSQPVWRQVTAEGQGAPLLIVMDASQSMLKNDISPSRDARAHLLINGLLTKGLNRPVGLLAAAGSSHVLLPPAVDPDIVKLYLSYLDPGVMPVDGGDLGDLARLLTATPGLLDGGASILLVTDGMSTGFEELQQVLVARKIPLATLTFTALGEQTAKKMGGPTISGDQLTPDNNSLYKLVARMKSANARDGEDWVDEYRWFVIPAALLMLLWFRRGVTLYWAPTAVAVFLLATPGTSRADVVDWFFTPDQQGMLLLKMGKYKEAAIRFDDPGWKAVSCYYAEDWDCASEEFARIPTEAGVYNMATAAAQGGSYKLARDTYAQLLKINPDYPHARSNYEQLVLIVQEIDDMSESQQDDKAPAPDENAKPEKGNPADRADGAEEQGFGARKVKQLTAAEVLKSKEMTDRWLRDITRDPKMFIRAKFQYEYARMQESDSES